MSDKIKNIEALIEEKVRSKLKDDFHKKWRDFAMIRSASKSLRWGRKVDEEMEYFPLGVAVSVESMRSEYVEHYLKSGIEFEAKAFQAKVDEALAISQELQDYAQQP